jgi:tRNA threonylcarbamoyladenosine biosynthesis protein TsaB
MALILSLDSTTSVCSAAIHQDGKLIESEFSSEPRAAASQLGVMVKNVIQKAQINPKELSAIAVSSGPGSYTGLRIATSTAKGLCFALDLPLIGVNSLLVLTQQVLRKAETDFFCPMLDARRMEVYCALLDANLNFIAPVEAKVLTEESFRENLKQSKIAFFGDGSAKFKNLTNHINAVFVDSIQPSAIDLGYLAYNQYKNQKFESLDTFEPYYLKDFMIKKKN